MDFTGILPDASGPERLEDVETNVDAPRRLVPAAPAEDEAWLVEAAEALGASGRFWARFDSLDDELRDEALFAGAERIVIPADADGVLEWIATCDPVSLAVEGNRTQLRQLPLEAGMAVLVEEAFEEEGVLVFRPDGPDWQLV